MVNLTESMILNILKAHEPIKAIRICSMINKEYGDISKRDINSLLYRMLKKGSVHKSENYEWSVNKEPGRKISKRDLDNITPSHQKIVQNTDPFYEKINFSDEQKNIIDLDLSDSLLIRGQAGCGKTTVLAARAGRSLSLYGKGSLLFLTYNSALCKYVSKLFQSNSVSKNITVSTFHEWAVNLAEAMGYSFGGWVQQKDRTEQIKAILRSARSEKGVHRLYDPENMDIVAWWNEEISWIFGQGIFDFETYKTIERVGRGTAIRISLTDREYVWYIFSKYIEWLKKEGKEDYDNVADLINRAKESFGSVVPENLKYDHVFIDEVQDFDKSWLSVLASIPRISLSMAGDIAQKIYKRSFTWKSVGIKIHSHRSLPLRGSFRTTKQIMTVGSMIIQNCQMQSDEEYVNPIMPIKQGPLIKRILRQGIKNAYTEGYEYVANEFKRIRTKTVVIALPLSRQVYPAQKQLSSLGLKAKTAKGGSLGKVSSGIVVTNYHQLKGLEFDHVVLMGLEDQTFPGRYLEKTLSDDILDEENVLRKLLYVAMTRAKETLTIVGGKPFCRFFNDVSNEWMIDI